MMSFKQDVELWITSAFQKCLADVMNCTVNIYPFSLLVFPHATLEYYYNLFRSISTVRVGGGGVLFGNANYFLRLVEQSSTFQRGIRPPLLSERGGVPLIPSTGIG